MLDCATMQPKKPRRTAERILELTLDLFNRFGEPNVSTTLISAELNISPGNLYYHYPAKDELINSLFDRYEKALSELLGAADNVRHIEDAWLFFHMLFELIWQYRFLYRDLNDLLSKNRRLETHFQFVLKNKSSAVRNVLGGLSRGSSMRIDNREAEPVPKDDKVLAAWALFHAGEFQKACEAGLKAGGAGVTVANKAQAIHANYLEKSEKTKLAMFLEVSQRAQAQAEAEPENANA